MRHLLMLTLGTIFALTAAEPAPAVAWMSWEGGVDVLGVTQPGLAQPNVILHVARMVHTPLGSAPSGIVFYQPDPAKAPVVAGFVCSDAAIGAYYGPNVFAGTPFAGLPVLSATIAVVNDGSTARSRIEVGGHVFTVTLSNLAPATVVDRAPGAFPFRQMGVERAAATAVVTVDGQPVTIIVPPADPVEGPRAVFASTGLYVR